MNISLPSAVNAWLSAGGQLIQTQLRRNPKRLTGLTGLIAALTLSGAGGAFAIASMAPDASDLPVRQVMEAIEPVSAANAALASGAAQDAALTSQPLTLFRSDVTRASDTADTLLKRLGVNDAAAASFLRSNDATRKYLFGRAGRGVSAEAGADNGLLKLTARWASQDDGNFSRLVIEKSADGFKASVQTAPLTTTTRLASGTISSSLFAATDEARLPDTVATQVAEIFSGDIDFHRALRKGDRFSVTYESLEGDGEPMRAGRVLSAEFVNNGKTFQAMWFAAPAQAGQGSQKGAYYTLDGKSLRRAFLASPLEFSRITSGFKMRLHPISLVWKAHLGVDYAAPTGTAVRSIGDGVVEFAGVQNGFGNVVMVNHGNTNTTVYAHLSRINVHKGEKVSQSQNIGAVGATGWATGPHLHFEFRVNGIHHDPLTIARQSDTVPVTAEAKPLFDSTASNVRLALSAAASMQRASAE